MFHYQHIPTLRDSQGGYLGEVHNFTAALPDFQVNLSIPLEGSGFNILEAEDGEVGIALLRLEDNMINVGLILCDIRMPKVNGVGCVDFLKRETPGIPVVMVTGYPDTEMATPFLKKGVKDYLVKPVEKEKLMAVVDNIVAVEKRSDCNNDYR